MMMMSWSDCGSKERRRNFSMKSLNHSNHDETHRDTFDLSESPHFARKTSFILPESVQFGYHESAHSRQMSLSEDKLTATKIDPNSHYAHGVCYGAIPLRGTAEFEVEITSYGTGWSGTMKLGVMRCKTDSKLAGSIPRYSPEGQDHCVWSSNKIHNRLTGGPTEVEPEKRYGDRNLDDLTVDDKVGFRLSYDGNLTFFVNGTSQGIAADNIYLRGYDVYPVVDHYANCKATRIVRAAMRIDLNLQDLCVELLASWLRSKQDAERLPLPVRLINRLVQSIDK